MTTSARTAKKSLKHGRPPILQSGRPRLAMSAKSTRTLIRSHHELERALAKASREGDGDKASTIKQKLERQGGLELYQQASLQGQSRDRGGDSSKLLLEWLKSDVEVLRTGQKLRVLEVGALSTRNECSRSPAMDVTRIDLHSQEAGILQQDFMERPLPPSIDDGTRFDVISLSLVLNYVPTPEGRGEMLRRTLKFLKKPNNADTRSTTALPALFLVLPAPCVTNSRYLDASRLAQIMTLLGYTLTQQKCSAKLISYLWTWQGTIEDVSQLTLSKKEVHPGAKRNNFCVVLD